MKFYKSKKAFTMVELVTAIVLGSFILFQLYFFYGKLNTEQSETVKFSDVNHTFQFIEFYLRQDLKLFSGGFVLQPDSINFYRIEKGEAINQPNEVFVSYIIENKNLKRKINGVTVNTFEGITSISAVKRNNYYIISVFSENSEMEVVVFPKPFETINEDFQ